MGSPPRGSKPVQKSHVTNQVFYNLLWKKNVYDKVFCLYSKVSLGRRNILKVTVKNTGRRSAFVKAVCYAGIVLRCRQNKSCFFLMNCNNSSSIVHIV